MGRSDLFRLATVVNTLVHAVRAQVSHTDQGSLTTSSPVWLQGACPLLGLGQRQRVHDQHLQRLRRLFFLHRMRSVVEPDDLFCRRAHVLVPFTEHGRRGNEIVSTVKKHHRTGKPGVAYEAEP